jgi:hypothetical protein
MALIRGTALVSVAALTLAGVAVQPAQAYWQAAGRGTGTVPTATAAANVLTLQLAATGMGHAVKASGKAGTGSPYATSVTVVLCKANSFPCTSANGATTLTATVNAGTYAVNSGNLNSWPAVYGQATQLQTSGWRDYANAPTAVLNP